MQTTLRALALSAALAAALCLGACQSAGMKPTAERTLYDRLGGKPVIAAVVDDFVGNVAADSRINGFLARANVPRLKVNLVDQICQATGGPCVYKGRDMMSAHKGMGIGQADFNALARIASIARQVQRSGEGAGRASRHTGAAQAADCEPVTQAGPLGSGAGQHAVADTTPSAGESSRPPALPRLRAGNPARSEAPAAKGCLESKVPSSPRGLKSLPRSPPTG
ncbi:MAG TPA: group 1 truncated hemoglobin [Casimicrobiaceae bacterium]|nr:group 1 truncated hemoglobin [Casimicrobiaceae bacterium]